MNTNHPLKEKLREVEENGGSLTIGPADLSGEDSNSSNEQNTDSQTESVNSVGPTTVEVPSEAKKDMLLDGGNISVKNIVNLASAFDQDIDQVVITEDDKEAFLDAVIRGTRYIRPFSLYRGKLKGKFRCRLVEESEAIVLWLSILVREKNIDDLKYFSVLRNALLTAQLEELNGVKYPQLPKPLYRQLNQDGKTYTDPAWVQLLNRWDTESDALLTALYQELRVFERKYWTMIINARDQNFWNPAESI